MPIILAASVPSTIIGAILAGLFLCVIADVIRRSLKAPEPYARCHDCGADIYQGEDPDLCVRCMIIKEQEQL